MGLRTNKIINTTIVNPLKNMANSKPMEYVCKQYRENNSKFITGLSVSSIVTKDGYGCYIYVEQNEHNKKIPEDKRKFISGLDLANGLLMMGAQIIAYATIAKKATQKKIFNKVVGKYFSESKYKKIEKNALKNVKGSTSEKIKKEFDKTKENTEVALTHFATLVTTTILAKRVVVPYIATPLADIYKKHFENKDANKKEK